MGKKKKIEQLPLRINLFQPNKNETRWISYDIEDLKIEVMVIDNMWVASGTFDDEYNYFYGQELTEYATNRVVALTSLLSYVGLPLILGLSQEIQSTLYNIYPDIEFCWEGKENQIPQIEKILPNLHMLDIKFDERSKETWVWRGLYCNIEVIFIDDIWIISCEPKIRNDDSKQRPQITIENKNRDEAINLLLNHPDTAFVLGFSKNQGVNLNKIFKKVRVVWRSQTKSARQQTKTRRNLTESTNSPCSWEKIAKECDSSFNCSFCSSSGTAYFVRWDD